MTQEKQNRSTLILLLLLLITSVGLNVYQWKNHSATLISSANTIDSLSTANIDVETELKGVTLELEKYRGIANNLDSLLNDANSKIETQEKKIRGLMASEKNKTKLQAQLKEEIAELHKLRDEYLEKIDNLMAENKALKAENSNLNDKVTNLNDQKNLLEQKVTTASQLKAEYVKVSSFKKKSSGRFVESVLAKRTNKLEACFTVLDNKVTTPGDKMVYLRIVAPNGQVLMGYTKTSFTTAEGQSVDATSSLKMTYNGDKQDLCLAYENEERILEPGTYVVEIYLENVLVHQSNYILK